MNEYEQAIEKLVNEYDAFFVCNKYGNENTHAAEFELLEQLSRSDNKVMNALAWIKHEYDCYYKKDYDLENGPFHYLREIARKENKQ